VAATAQKDQHAKARISERLRVVAHELRQDREGRRTLNVADESDAQDSVRTLLRVNFDDTRPEKRTPSYAGGARGWIPLARDQAAAEIKITRPNLSRKPSSEHSALDIAKYGGILSAAHCSALSMIEQTNEE
jgi:hypothetical protein